MTFSVSSYLKFDHFHLRELFVLIVYHTKTELKEELTKKLYILLGWQQSFCVFFKNFIFIF